MANLKTVVLGASTNPARYSYKATERLQASGIEVVPVGIRKGMCAGLPIQNNNPAIDDVHTITLYLNPTVQEDYYSYILSLCPKRVIFNPGTENTALYGLLKRELPSTQIEVACTLVLLSLDAYAS